MVRCRFCYAEINRESSKDIFNNGPAPNISIAQVAEMLTKLAISENDPYTRVCCIRCFHMLTFFYNCRESILQAADQLFIVNEE